MRAACPLSCKRCSTAVRIWKGLFW
jgi:hypothetical protein